MFRTVLCWAALAAPTVAAAVDHIGGDLAGADLYVADGDRMGGTFTNVGHFEVPAGATVTVLPGQFLALSATSVAVEGTLEATRTGAFGGSGGLAPNNPPMVDAGGDGTGPGGGPGGNGGGNCDAGDGGGGGGHGGLGGLGASFDTPRTPGGPVAGSTGLPYNPSTDAGSGGGGGGSGCIDDGADGGRGGGSILLQAEQVDINGVITADGGGGDLGVVGGGAGGGGAGGSIVLIGNHVGGFGTLNARGGDGGDADVTGRAGGGGGGAGGRVKLFYVTTQPLAINVAGGLGGVSPAAVANGATPGQQGAGFQQLLDGDSDGWVDPLDNCLGLHNPFQIDVNGDGTGDACSGCSDVDGDEWCDVDDICPLGDDNLDDDADGVPDACDRCPGGDDALDQDADTFPDDCDNCPSDPQLNQADGDGDGAGNVCDCEPANAAVGAATTWYSDTDGDGDGDPLTAVDACIAPYQTVANDLDCDDTNPAIWTGATEICNAGVDDDCDALADDADPDVDLSAATVYFPDGDGDGYGDDTDPGTPACLQPSGTVDDGTDCDDTSSAIHPGVPEINGDGIDQDCDGADGSDATADADNDGVPDLKEFEIGSNPLDGDTDGDGHGDGEEYGDGATAIDTDGDGQVDVLDTDDDGDGCETSGEPDGDEDGDGIPNHLDPDADGDGSYDGAEGCGQYNDGADGTDQVSAVEQRYGFGIGCATAPGSGAPWFALWLLAVLPAVRRR